jgi:c(7)-type cytochrome triheme protein
VNASVRRGGRSGIYVLLLPLFLALSSCSDETLSLFFDIPPPTEEEKAERAAAKQQAAAATATRTVAPAVEEEQEPPPEIEAILDWEQASEMLPKDEIDEVDWSAALREGIIRPRAALSGRGDPEANLFKWDFYFSGPDPESDAYFPHSEHTEWLTCESCHPAIFPYRELGMANSEDHGIVMDEIFEGEYCGKCHGVVAFVLDSCSRCHTKM